MMKNYGLFDIKGLERQIMKDYFGRVWRLVLGLFLYALGSFLSIQANIGLAPWEAFSMGLSYVTGVTYGNVVVLSGFVIIVIDFWLKEKIGFGTILNAILIGKFVDLIQFMEIVPLMSDFYQGLAMLIAGQFVIALGSYYYIGAQLGCGPRDALMVAVGKRLPNVPIGVIRTMLEGSVLFIGWLLGAKVGIGTVVAVFGIGIALQMTFKVLDFDVKVIVHEDMNDTLKWVSDKKAI